MLRSQKRRLKEYLITQKFSATNEAIKMDKKRLLTAIEREKSVPHELRDKVDMRMKLDLEDARTLNLSAEESQRDDEYRHAGMYEPRVLITTSSNPSQPLLRFVKELKLLIPNSERINRGQTSAKALIDLCRRDDITDIIEVSGSDGEGRPTMMTVCHMPFGPTAHFTVKDVQMRADLPDKPAHMTQAKPNLIFHNFESKLGLRFCSILKHLFPPMSNKEKSQRVITFSNRADEIIFRHHTWESSSTLRKFRQKDPALDNMTQAEKDKLTSRLAISELGPRFTLIPFKIIRSTMDDKLGDSEWTRATFIRKAKPILG